MTWTMTWTIASLMTSPERLSPRAGRGVAIEVTRELRRGQEPPRPCAWRFPRTWRPSTRRSLAHLRHFETTASPARRACRCATGDRRRHPSSSSAATGVRTVEGVLDGGRYRVRCADDLSVNDDDKSAAARKRRDEDASFEVDVAPREDPTREGATIRLPGARRSRACHARTSANASASPWGHRQTRATRGTPRWDCTASTGR